jgi:hypothetical protein
MRRDVQYEVLLKRSSDCEMLAQLAKDISIRKKCAELAVEYRNLADQMKRIDFTTSLLASMDRASCNSRPSASDSLECSRLGSDR